MRKLDEQSDIIRFDLAIKRIIRRELAEAHGKWGNRFDLVCIEQSWGDKLDDLQMLSAIRTFNRTGSFFVNGNMSGSHVAAPSGERIYSEGRAAKCNRR